MASNNPESSYGGPYNIQGLTDGSEVSTPRELPKELSDAYFDDAYDKVNFGSYDADDESSDDEYEKLERLFTHQSKAEEEQGDDDSDQQERDEAADRGYVERLLGEEGESGLSISRFEGWLGKDVLLQGNIFLTKRYFLFYAHLPSATLETLKASPLAKKSKRNIGTSYYHRYWFVLRMGSFTWYRNPGDIYFPTGLLSLELMLSVALNESSPEKFVIKAKNGKSYTFKADSRNAAHEWVKAIKKEIFRAGNQNSEPLAVVRIPLENIFHLRVVKPLDVVKLVTMQVILDPSASASNQADNFTKYTFAFFGDSKDPKAIVERIATATNDLENHRAVSFNYVDGLAEVDYDRSQFGPIQEGVYDTTPATQFRINHANLGTDREIVYSSDSVAGGSYALYPTRASASSTPSSALSPTVSSSQSRSSSRVPTRAGSPSGASTPTSSHKSSKIKILSSLNHKLSKLKVEDLKPDVSSLANAAALPIKMPFGEKDKDSVSYEGDESDDDDDADSDYGDDDSKSKFSPKASGSKFFDDHYMPFTAQNFTKKLRFGNEDLDATEGVDCDAVHNTSDLELLNKWFRDHFGLDNTVNLLSEYICSVRKPGESGLWSDGGGMWSGKLFISTQFLCFQRRSAGGRAWRMVIPLRDIIHLKDQPMESTEFVFEVAEPAYSEFIFVFKEPAGRRDAEGMLRSVVQKVPENDPDVRRDREAASHNLDEDSESRFIEYSLRSARLVTYEPTMAAQMRSRIPPMLFDPKSSQYKEIFLQKPMKQMKFVMLMIGSRGDVQPYIALSQGLMEEGHKCCIVTHKEFKDWVESFGIEFREVAGDPRELMEIMISHGSISYGFMKEALSHFKSWLKELMLTAWEAVKSAEPDVFLESPSSMIGIHIAEALNIPYFRAFTMPWTRTKVYPQALIAPDQKRAGNYNAFTYVLYDRLVWFGISKYVNRWRKKNLGLPETDLENLRQDDVPFLYCVSPTVLVPPIDQPDWVHTCGYWELRQDKKDKEKGADPAVQKFIDSARAQKKPVVYIGFGSIIVSDPEAMTQTVVEATKKAGVYCILARGWSSRSTKKDTDKGETKEEKKPLNQDHIHEVDSVSHQWLFPRVDVCVHHGGSGTTGASLRAGKPTIIKPFFGDQFFYGRRVEDLGVGFNLKKLTMTGLRDALKECTSNKQMIRQAAVLGDQISHEHGVDEAILSIYRELTYADDVTKRRRKMNADAAKSGLLKNLHPDGLFSHDKKKLSDSDDSHSWFSLPKLGRREEQRRDRDSNSEVDVSV